MKNPLLALIRRLQRHAPEISLICMRLTHMAVVHPEQITAPCTRCGCSCGIYPSGQKIIERYGERVKVVCHLCARAAGMSTDHLAPGAEDEPAQSVRK